MVLADTSVWIDHFRKADTELMRLLSAAQIYTHAFVIGELALGSIKQRELIIETMKNLPQAPMLQDAEVLEFIDRNKLAGKGIGYIDAHLLASARFGGLTLWTKDKKLAQLV